MRRFIVAMFFLLSGCEALTGQTVYVPTEVDDPAPVECKMPFVPKPAQPLALLTVKSTLTDGMKACLAQHDYDVGYQQQLEAAVSACQ